MQGKNMVWRVLQLLILPASFARDSVKHDASEATDRDAYHEEVRSRIRKKRIGFLVAFAIVLLVVSLGFAAAALSNLYLDVPTSIVIMSRIASISIVAWSVLGRLGYETETWKGQTLLEQTSLFSFKFFYCLGLFLAVWSLLIESGNGT